VIAPLLVQPTGLGSAHEGERMGMRRRRTEEEEMGCRGDITTAADGWPSKLHF
jgi:hypothetical protein